MKGFWTRLNPKLKTLIVALGSSAGTAAIDAMIQAASTGAVHNPGEALRVGGLAALASVKTFWMLSPRQRPTL